MEDSYPIDQDLGNSGVACIFGSDNVANLIHTTGRHLRFIVLETTRADVNAERENPTVRFLMVARR